MPWNHCGSTIYDDDLRCPHCGISKPAWTLKLDRTRLLKLSGQKFEGDVEAQVATLTEAAAAGTPFCEKCMQTWLALRVTDADGLPLKEEPYKVVFCNGEEREGKTDENGLVQLQDFPDGAVKVIFPDRDVSEVEQVQVATKDSAAGEDEGGEDEGGEPTEGA